MYLNKHKNYFHKFINILRGKKVLYHSLISYNSIFLSTTQNNSTIYNPWLLGLSEI